ncbi:dihydroflavonol-4-reductase [Sphaerisporangium krabiense]|uniref:Dihydroflavonol-4-reductase n=1 Tax=Sphaerisporangium krabiense TaxID=763782 RepID=A0A7W8Z082_9ACTN|nr:NAD-dependent epimerase/dehydratase family protein [Sphaerisporangium krabiense]MBB5625083.1 dihydroflavonol-4-reductase [Sphaerisporangium krabiense]GII67318.1 dihydroflavonol-4-reductase [Sphaerisporangium krabiense]
MTDTVLVTGGTGYLAGWCVRELLRQGYAVRATVRDLARADEVLALAEDRSRLSVVRADLGADEGWDRAADGCAYVLHVASPFPRVAPKDPGALVGPAREGTLRVLRAAAGAGVTRVVLTSSSSTVGHGRPARGGALDETDWADPARSRAYVRSKILAERAAWDFVAERGARGSLVTLAPSTMIGPVIGAHRSYSVLAVSRLLDGAMPGLPRLGFSLVDVRDVAALHVRAMTEPAAAGGRFIADAGFRWMTQIAEVLRARLGPAAARVPSRRLPDLAVRLAALFDPELRQVIDELGVRTDYATTAARTALGWAPRPLDDTIAECAESLVTRRVAA